MPCQCVCYLPCSNPSSSVLPGVVAQRKSAPALLTRLCTRRAPLRSQGGRSSQQAHVEGVARPELALELELGHVGFACS